MRSPDRGPRTDGWRCAVAPFGAAITRCAAVLAGQFCRIIARRAHVIDEAAIWPSDRAIPSISLTGDRLVGR